MTVPVASVKTESMKRAEEVLVKFAERNPEYFVNWVSEQINKGKMSIEEVVRLLGG